MSALLLRQTMTTSRHKHTVAYLLVLALILSIYHYFWISPCLTSPSHYNFDLTHSDLPSLPSDSSAPINTTVLNAKENNFVLEPYSGPQRVFPIWDKHPFPCIEGEDKWWTYPVLRSPSRTGLLFVRNMKTASSTIAGITIRIARNMAKKLGQTKMCKVRFDHTPASQLDYLNRDVNQSFLFSFVRDPTKRALSQFFHFKVSRNKTEPTLASFKTMFQELPWMSNYMIRDMALMNRPRYKNMTTHMVVQELLDDYDFIGVTERLEESLVVLKLILGLDFGDILYLSAAKGQGGFDDGAFHNTCYYIVPTIVTPAMEEYFKSQQWQRLNELDMMLHHAANYSLDLTINRLGRSMVQAQVQEFRRLLKRAQEECLQEAVFPCSADGIGPTRNHTCLFWDAGCGYQCLDNMTL